MVKFGQVVVGPPGAGKTTYCQGMQMYFETIGRKCSIVNLDFANEKVPYKAAVDVRDLIKLEDVMEEHNLGPNGGLVFCMESLLQDIDWLQEKMTDAITDHYIIFDFPGQVELYTHNTAVQDMIRQLERMEYRLCSVCLIDSFCCCEPSTFISAVLVVAGIMLRLALPHISILSKIDLLPHYGQLPFNLDFFTELYDITPLSRYVGEQIASPEQLAADDLKSIAEVTQIEAEIRQNSCSSDANSSSSSSKRPTSFKEKHKRLSEALCEVLADSGLVRFYPLNIEDVEMMTVIAGAIDKANGYSFAAAQLRDYKNNASFHNASSGALGEDRASDIQSLFQLASQDLQLVYQRSLEIQERYYHADVLHDDSSKKSSSTHQAAKG